VARWAQNQKKPGADWAGARPFSGPSLPFCLPVIATNKVDRFVNHCLSAFPSNTKTSKTSQISLGSREKLLGRTGFVL
jgi:hypothetical protein